MDENVKKKKGNYFYYGLSGQHINDCKYKKRVEKGHGTSNQANTIQSSTCTNVIVENEILKKKLACLVAIQDSKTWLLDLGCTHHRNPHREWFHEYIPLIKIHVMYMGDMKIQQAIGVGTIIIHLYSSHEINV
jgi:hypothetical protein